MAWRHCWEELNVDRERLRQGALIAAIVVTLVGCPICCFAVAAAVVALVPAQHTTSRPALVAVTAARLTPAEVEIGAGETTTVTLHVDGVTDLYGYQVTIDFDPDVLEVVDADEHEPGIQVALGNFLSPDYVHENAADNTRGRIVCVITQLAPTTPVTGSGDLLIVTMSGRARGTSDLNLIDLKLANAEGIEIPAAKHSAQVTVRR
jgi:hypothetical protein